MQPDSVPEPASVLLVDDDDELLDMLQSYLQREGYAVGRADDGVVGVREAQSGRHAIAVIDMMMPRMGGIETLKAIRASTDMPVIMLTAKGDDMDRIVGLEIGADDYISKPCSPRELLARIRAVLRRTRQPGDTTVITGTLIHVGSLLIDPQRRLVERDGASVALTSTEYNLIEILGRRLGGPVSKEVLSELGLGRRLAPFDRSVDVHVSSIRQKLGVHKDGRSYIATVHRLGYQLIPQ